MKRIGFLVFLLSALCAPAATKPNILFIAIDDMNDWTGFLGGHPQAQTPNLDRLAKRGVNFLNAHCSAPGCSPSRNALLYGVEPFHSGLYAFYEDGAPKDVVKPYKSLPQFLREHGYQTFGAGKIYHGSLHAPEDWNDYLEPTKDKLNLDVAAGYRIGDSFKMAFCPTTNPLEEHHDYKVASYGVEMLKQKHDQPFFLAVGIVKPHLPFICPKRFFDLYPEEVQPPPIKSDDLDDIPAVGLSMVKSREDRRFKQDQAWNKVRRAYLACISWADFNIGRVLEALADSPYADNTIVVVWSDHGFALGEKNHFTKFALWEVTTRVPFIIWDARDKTAPAGRTVADPVSLIDIYRTLADFVGEEAPAYVDGVSLVPQLKNPATAVGQPAICTWGRGNYAVRDRDWRYIRYYDGTEELYPHTTDPNEWFNQANHPEYADVKQRLAATIPSREAPLVKDGAAEWSVAVSADKPLESKGKKKVAK